MRGYLPANPRPFGNGGVYPRGCGATPPGRPGAGRRRGLSPRMRGYQKGSGIATRHQRSIPADAGLPPARRHCGAPRRVYPRGCGATERAETAEPSAVGLSPRMRGYRRSGSSSVNGSGSIPADAGLPLGQASESPLGQVYPRGCGATASRGMCIGPPSGLSPRMRGYLLAVLLRCHVIGSIPADAGLPCRSRRCRGRCKVYPRGCGATQLEGCVGVGREGLSPRMRGYRPIANPVGERLGSIPADAGLPQSGVVERRLAEVYPRGCGATPATVCQEPGATGPSLRISPRKDDSLSQGRTAPSTKERHGPDATIVLASGRRRCAAGTWDAVTVPCATPPKPPALVPATCRSS